MAAAQLMPGAELYGCSPVTATVEDYLKGIFLLGGVAGGPLVSTGHLADRLDVTPGSATVMVKALAERGQGIHQPYAGVRLTCAGQLLAAHVLRRHRLLELFLVEILKFDWSEVHVEAERLEHAVSDQIIDRIDEMLGRPDVDPHGDPIPNAAGELYDPPYDNTRRV